MDCNLRTGSIVSFSGGGAGEANTASNLGAGSGVFAGKVGVDLRFKSLIAGTGISLTPTATDITITSSPNAEEIQDIVGAFVVDSASINFTYDDGANTLTGTVLPAGVDHDQLLNFVANKHIDHTTVSIATAATSGLQGGGDISATRNLSININGMTSLTGDIDPLVDTVSLYDSSGAAHFKTPIYKLFHAAPDRFIRRQSDFIESALDGLTSTEAGAGTSTQVGTFGIDATENAEGVSQSDTGGSASGRVTVGIASFNQLQNQASTTMRLAVRQAPEILSDGTQRFTLYNGFLDNTGAGDHTDGAYFRYVDNVNGGRWEAVTAAGGVRTATDTGVAATTTYSIFEVILTTTQALFYIDGTLVATNVTNIPTGSTQTFGYGWKIEKSVGGTARNLSTDWFYFEMERSSAR